MYILDARNLHEGGELMMMTWRAEDRMA